MKTNQSLQPANQPPLPEKSPYSVSPVGPEQARGWDVIIDGQKITPGELVISNSRFGSAVRYGMRPEGYDGVVITERGGAVTLPYFVSGGGQVYVGLIEEGRPTTGYESVLNAPRGMANIGESRADTARREFEEETGLGATAPDMELAEVASDVNANTTYFNTSETPGASFYSLAVPQEILELKVDGDGTPYYAFPERTAQKAPDAATEKIMGSRFVPLEAALGSKDMFTGYAVGQLVLQLMRDGQYLVPQTPLARDRDLTSAQQQ